MRINFTLIYSPPKAAGQVPTIGIPPPSLGEATAALPIPPPPQPAASQMTRQARRLYIGNIPFGLTEDLMVNFFNEKMKEANLMSAPGNPVLAVQINMDKNFAFIEVIGRWRGMCIYWGCRKEDWCGFIDANVETMMCIY